MSKYEDNREQADAELQRIQDDLRRLDDARTDAEARSEELESRMNAAHETGDGGELEQLSDEHRKVQQEIEDYSTDFEIASGELSRATKFWGFGR